ncbi:MAG: ATP-dependent protease [Gammaproteobacteria bacterium]|nr:MAG: ATP-dependent protease [Gammaproteobacteria bacterium]
MSLSVIHTRALAGINAPEVTVEVHLSNGLPSLSIVGLPEAAVKESKDRVRSAILNCGFEFPQRRLTINLAPADLPKDGGRFDLPIALGILAASGQIPADNLDRYEFLGELSLGGELHRVNGVLPAVVRADRLTRSVVVPKGNIDEAELVRNATIYSASHLLEVTQHIATGNTLHPHQSHQSDDELYEFDVDMKDVHGQAQAKRALEIAAAGQHSLLLVGPPGTGKSMLAQRLPTILPPLTESEALETASVHSLTISGKVSSVWRQRPYRAPHHTASSVALVGGGSIPRPGEISLAHNGVLFLDELPEFERRVLDSLREPLETGQIVISRAARQAEFPADVQLIGAMNPCPCGYLGDNHHVCRDTPDQIQRYRSRLTGPFLDRIDMFIEVPRVKIADIHNSNETTESSEAIRKRVIKARERQLDRFGVANARMKPAAIKASCGLSSTDSALLVDITERLGLSSRAHDRILRVARTIADLDGSDTIMKSHLTEAIGYRRFMSKTTYN